MYNASIHSLLAEVGDLLHISALAASAIDGDFASAFQTAANLAQCKIKMLSELLDEMLEPTADMIAVTSDTRSQFLRTAIDLIEEAANRGRLASAERVVSCLDAARAAALRELQAINGRNEIKSVTNSDSFTAA
jgi:hypothetical protein